MSQRYHSPIAKRHVSHICLLFKCVYWESSINIVFDKNADICEQENSEKKVKGNGKSTCDRPAREICPLVASVDMGQKREDEGSQSKVYMRAHENALMRRLNKRRRMHRGIVLRYSRPPVNVIIEKKVHTADSEVVLLLHSALSSASPIHPHTLLLFPLFRLSIEKKFLFLHFLPIKNWLVYR